MARRRGRPAFEVLLPAVVSMIVVSGTVTDEGVECRAMRGDDGHLYTFLSLPGEIAVGDRIEVRGQQLDDSPCQQGTTIRAERIRRPATGGQPDQVWE